MRVRIIMCLLVLFATIKSHADIWQGESDTSWYNTDQQEFKILNSAQFKGLADLVNNAGVTFEDCDVYLMSDIDLNNMQWQPIGYGNTNFGGSDFKGRFFGNQHNIKGMLINCRELPYTSGTGIGLFGNCSGDLSGLNLSGVVNVDNDSYYSSSLFYIGGLCGDSNGIIQECSCEIYMNVKATNSFMSIGLVAGKSKIIQKVKVNGSINTSETIQAGIGGLSHRAEIVDQCSVEADIDLKLASSSNMGAIGGIVGYTTDITNSIFNGNFRISGQTREYSIGGIAAAATKIRNVIFAPRIVSMNVIYDPSWMYGNFVGAICSPFLASNCDVENSYYTNNLNGHALNGYEVTQDYLCSGSVLDGFSSGIWAFKEGFLPSIKALMSVYLIQSIVNNGRVGIEVREGDSLTYVITPDNGWRVYRFYLNDQDYTWALSQNRYRFDNIDRSYQIKVIFEKEDNAVHGVGIDASNRIKLKNNSVTVYDLMKGQLITVVSPDGIVESRMIAESNTVSFDVSNGIHIIHIGGRSYKIIN